MIQDVSNSKRKKTKEIAYYNWMINSNLENFNFIFILNFNEEYFKISYKQFYSHNKS